MTYTAQFLAHNKPNYTSCKRIRDNLYLRERYLSRIGSCHSLKNLQFMYYHQIHRNDKSHSYTISNQKFAKGYKKTVIHIEKYLYIYLFNIQYVDRGIITSLTFIFVSIIFSLFFSCELFLLIFISLHSHSNLFPLHIYFNYQN